VKKVVVLIIVLAVLLLGTPAVIGGLAEKAVSENLSWAADSVSEGDVSVVVESFEGGWFTSYGVQRIRVTDVSGLPMNDLSQLESTMADILSSGSIPELVIETRLDHGLVPFTSLSAERGSLKPGLGVAHSTLHLEVDGERSTLPGAVVSHVGLGGSIVSEYKLEAGSTVDDDETIAWGDVSVEVLTNARTGRIAIDSRSDGLTVDSPDDNVRFDSMVITIDQQPTGYGLYVGSMDIRLDKLFVSTRELPTPIEFNAVRVTSESSSSGDVLTADARVEMAAFGLPEVGDMSVVMDFAMGGLEGPAFNNLVNTVNAADESLPGDALYVMMKADLERLFERGFRFDIRALDVDLAAGGLDTVATVTVPGTGTTDLDWPAIANSVEANADLSVEQGLMDYVLALQPQANALIAMGMLKREGDAYMMNAAYKQGLVTVNGAPMPIPIPGIN